MNSLVIFGLLAVLMLTVMPISISLGLTVLTFLFTMTHEGHTPSQHPCPRPADMDPQRHSQLLRGGSPACGIFIGELRG